MNTIRTKAVGAFLMALLAVGCGSSGVGDILGNPSSTANNANEIRGTVYDVDTRDRFITLTNVDPRNSSGLASGGNDVRVYFDDRTTVSFQGATYRPDQLERGDQIAVRVAESGNRLTAASIDVLYDSSRNSGNSTTLYGDSVRGTVRNVDTNRRTIELDRGFSTSSASIIEYDQNTTVSFNGQRYRPEDLERGDEIEIFTRELSDRRLLADRVEVLRDKNGTVGSGTTNTATSGTVRGTVRYVDTNRRTIELDQATWSRNFTTGGSTVVLTYESGTQVEFRGQMHPVSNLERGDVIDVRVRQYGSNNLAERITVVRDVNSF